MKLLIIQNDNLLIMWKKNLLKVGELCDLHSVHPDFPSQSPSTKNLQAFPVNRIKEIKKIIRRTKDMDFMFYCACNQEALQQNATEKVKMDFSKLVPRHQKN